MWLPGQIDAETIRNPCTISPHCCSVSVRLLSLDSATFRSHKCLLGQGDHNPANGPSDARHPDSPLVRVAMVEKWNCRDNEGADHLFHILRNRKMRRPLQKHRFWDRMKRW